MKVVDFVKPESVEETASVLHELGHKAALIAGGTSFQFSKSEAEKTAVVLDIESLKGITKESNSFVIGALTNISDLQEFSADDWVLDRVAKKFSSQQIRNISTLGGNIAQVFPWSDFPVVLLFDLRILLPSTATTSPLVKSEIDAIQLEKHCENSLWSNRANNVPKTSCDGIPFLNGK